MSLAEDDEQRSFDEALPIFRCAVAQIIGICDFRFHALEWELRGASSTSGERLALWTVLLENGTGVNRYERWKFERALFDAAIEVMADRHISIPVQTTCWESRLRFVDSLMLHEERGVPPETVDCEICKVAGTRGWEFEFDSTDENESRDFRALVQQRNRTLMRRVGAELMLPRYMVADTWKLVVSEIKMLKMFSFIAGCVLTTAVAGLLSWYLLVPDEGRVAQLLGVMSFAFLMCGVASGVAGGPLVLNALLTRLIASCGVGWALLITVFNDDELFRDSGPSELASVVVGLVFYLYLSIEVRLHGAAPSQMLVRRTLVVWVVSAVYASLMSLAICGLVLPYLRPGSWALLGNSYQYARFVAMTAGASLLVGAVLQVLWDDRPITAPLGRRTWRSAP